MADKPVTVAVPEERVPEFYSSFAEFLAAAPGRTPSPGCTASSHPPPGSCWTCCSRSPAATEKRDDDAQASSRDT